MDRSRGTKRGALTLVSQHCPHLVDHWKPCPSRCPCVECCGWLVLPLLLGSGVFLRKELGFHHITSPALIAGLCPRSSSPSTLHQMLCESGNTKGKNQTHTHPRRKRMEQITTEITTVLNRAFISEIATLLFPSVSVSRKFSAVSPSFSRKVITE